MKIHEMHERYPTKPERERKSNQEKLTILRFDVENLAWIVAGTSLSASFQASVALQRSKDIPRKVKTLLWVRVCFRI